MPRTDLPRQDIELTFICKQCSCNCGGMNPQQLIEDIEQHTDLLALLARLGKGGY